MNDNDIIHKVFVKPNYDTRTFESRLLFIKDLFEHTFDKVDIIGRCILHKLDVTYETAEDEVSTSMDALVNKNPVTVLKHINSLK